MGRHSKIKSLTPEQIAYRDRLLKGKIKKVKIGIKPPESTPEIDKMRECFYYLDHCVYWLNEYIDGKVKLENLLSTARAMQHWGKAIQEIITRKTNKP